MSKVRAADAYGPNCGETAVAQLDLVFTHDLRSRLHAQFVYT